MVQENAPLPDEGNSWKRPFRASLVFGWAMLGLGFAGVTLLSWLLTKGVGAEEGLVKWALGTESTPQRMYFLRLFLGLSNLLMWGLAAILWAKWNRTPWRALKLDYMPNFQIVFHVGFILLVALPLIASTAISWEHIHFPEFLSGLEEWFKNRENQTGGTLKKIMFDPSPGALAMNLVVAALIPAISEEFFFRGFLQQTLARKLNPHIAILITVFLFSALHFQLVGFFPRFILGILLGLVFYFSRSLWMSIFMHGWYNGLMIMGSWLAATQKPESLEGQAPNSGVPMVWVLASAASTVVLMFLFYKRTAPKEEE